MWSKTGLIRYPWPIAAQLTGAGGDPVVQLQTNFGGGKTHSMLALYHAFGDDFQLSNLPDYGEIQKLAGNIDDDLTARRAVIVGTSFNVSQPRQHADCTTRTIWGGLPTSWAVCRELAPFWWTVILSNWQPAQIVLG